MEWMVRRRGSRAVFKGGGRGSWACVPSVIPAGIAAAILGRAGRIAQRPCAVPGSGGGASRRRETLGRDWPVDPAELGWSMGQWAAGRGVEQRRGCHGGEEGADSGPGVLVGEGASARRGRLPGRPGLSARGGARAAEAASSWAERGGLRRGRWAMVWAVRGRGLGWTWGKGAGPREREEWAEGREAWAGLGPSGFYLFHLFSISKQFKSI